MKVKFAFLGDNKFMATIAAMRLALLSLLLLLLLPASLGLDGTIIQEEAFGQFNLPLLEDEDTNTTTTSPTTPTTPPATTNFTNTVQDPSIFLLRGFIGSTLHAQNAGGDN